MNGAPVVCEGAVVGSLLIPPFRLGAGQLLCLHMPGPSDSPDAEAFVRVLTGRQSIPGLRREGRVEYAAPLSCRWWDIFGLVARPPASLWLARSAGISMAMAWEIVELLDIRDDVSICRLSATDKVILGLEAVRARGADAVVFSTVGLDPLGIERVFAAVSTLPVQSSAIHLSYAYRVGGRLERSCPAGALCLDVAERPGLPTSDARVARRV
jgi:hypothetical protein